MDNVVPLKIMTNEELSSIVLKQQGLIEQMMSAWETQTKINEGLNDNFDSLRSSCRQMIDLVGDMARGPLS